MAQKAANWQSVLESGVDVAMLQEAKAPPEELRGRFIVDRWVGYLQVELILTAFPKWYVGNTENCAGKFYKALLCKVMIAR